MDREITSKYIKEIPSEKRSVTLNGVEGETIIDICWSKNKEG